jgi:serine/threonine protein kinase
VTRHTTLGRAPWPPTTGVEGNRARLTALSTGRPICTAGTVAPTLPSAAMTSALAGRYLLIDVIGRGGTGTVWRAWDLRERRFVAAKVISAYGAGPLLAFVREQALRIDHPHVLPPTGWAAEDHEAVLTTDLVRGGTADQLLAEHGALPESYAMVLLDQLLDALAAVHAAGVVHRDVKPANLLLEATGTGRPCLRLADFGVAARAGGPRPTGDAEAVGTNGYLAPELHRGAGPDPRQDLYSAGVTAIELLTARPPSATGRLPRSPFRPLLESLTHPDPHARPATAAAALAELRRIGVPAGAPWLHDRRPPDVPDRLGEVARPPAALRTTWLAVAGLGVGVALGAAALARGFG